MGAEVVPGFSTDDLDELLQRLAKVAALDSGFPVLIMWTQSGMTANRMEVRTAKGYSRNPPTGIEHVGVA